MTNDNYDDDESDQPQLSYEELIAKITHPKQRAFLEAYPKFGVTTETTKAIGIGETTIYDWFLKSRPLREAFEAVKKRIDATRLEENIKEVHRRGLEKSDLLLMFETKKLDTSYREKVTAIHFTGVIKVELAVPRPPEIETQKQIKEDNNAI